MLSGNALTHRALARVALIACFLAGPPVLAQQAAEEADPALAELGKGFVSQRSISLALIRLIDKTP